MRAVWVVTVLVGCGAPVAGGEDAAPVDPFAVLAGGPFDGTTIPWHVSGDVTGVPWMTFAEWPETVELFDRDESFRPRTITRAADGSPTGYDAPRGADCVYRRDAAYDDRYPLRVSFRCEAARMFIFDGSPEPVAFGLPPEPPTREIRRTPTGIGYFVPGDLVPEWGFIINASSNADAVFERRVGVDDAVSLVLDRRDPDGIGRQYAISGELVAREYFTRDVRGRITLYEVESVSGEKQPVARLTYRD